MPTFGNVIVSSSQVRMARAALGWSIKDLARESEVAERTIRRLEDPETRHTVTVHLYEKVIHTFERGGLLFVSADRYGGPGVREVQRPSV